MNLQSFYPIIVTPKIRECRDFYHRWFRLGTVFEASWFVLLGGSDGSGATVAFMRPDHGEGWAPVPLDEKVRQPAEAVATLVLRGVLGDPAG